MKWSKVFLRDSRSNFDVLNAKKTDISYYELNANRNNEAFTINYSKKRAS